MFLTVLATFSTVFAQDADHDPPPAERVTPDPFWVPKAGRLGNTFALSLPAGVFGSWAIATRWSPPDLQTPAKILEWGGVGLGFKVGDNVLYEFWPDVKRHIFHRKHSDADPAAVR